MRARSPHFGLFVQLLQKGEGGEHPDNRQVFVTGVVGPARDKKLSLSQADNKRGQRTQQTNFLTASENAKPANWSQFILSTKITKNNEKSKEYLRREPQQTCLGCRAFPLLAHCLGAQEGLGLGTLASSSASSLLMYTLAFLFSSPTSSKQRWTKASFCCVSSTT